MAVTIGTAAPRGDVIGRRRVGRARPAGCRRRRPPDARPPSANSLQLDVESSSIGLESHQRLGESRNCSRRRRSASPTVMAILGNGADGATEAPSDGQRTQSVPVTTGAMPIAGMDPEPAGAMADARHGGRTVDVGGRNLTPTGVECHCWSRRRRPLICAIIDLEPYGMPRFHFDTACGNRSYHDPDGVELESIDDARQQLIGLLRDLSMHDDSGIADKTVSARVICEGDVVLQGSCSLSIHLSAAWSPKL